MSHTILKIYQWVHLILLKDMHKMMCQRLNCIYLMFTSMNTFWASPPHIESSLYFVTLLWPLPNFKIAGYWQSQAQWANLRHLDIKMTTDPMSINCLFFLFGLKVLMTSFSQHQNDMIIMTSKRHQNDVLFGNSKWHIISKLNFYDIQTRSDLKFQIHPKLYTSFWQQFHYNRKTSRMTYTEKNISGMKKTVLYC